MLHFLFYGVPLLGALVYGLVEPGCNWMPDLSVFFAGAMAQVRSRTYGSVTLVMSHVTLVIFLSHVTLVIFLSRVPSSYLVTWMLIS